MTTPDSLQALLDGIRDEVREAVLEGDAQDCQSADCIADAVYEIVRVRLRAALADTPGLDVDALLDRIDALPRLDHDGADWVQLSDVLAAVKWWALAATARPLADGVSFTAPAQGPDVPRTYRQVADPVTAPEGWRWECPSCDGPVTALGMCETCGVFGIMRIGLTWAAARLTEDRP